MWHEVNDVGAGGMPIAGLKVSISINALLPAFAGSSTSQKSVV